MSRPTVVFVLSLAIPLAGAEGPADKNARTDSQAPRIEAGGRSVALPPVLKNSDPVDSRQLVLPGPAPRAPRQPAKPLDTPKTAGKTSEPAGSANRAQEPLAKRESPALTPPKAPAPAAKHDVPPPTPAPALRHDTPPATLAPAVKHDPAPSALAKAPEPSIRPPSPPPPLAVKTVYPAEFQRDSGEFCQSKIGLWTVADARALLGESLRQRPAIDDDKTENGHIYAFRDPSGRYRELELDFGREKGLLRTVFAYPSSMTWDDCRHLWGANVLTANANKGRVFHSYLNRKLDVLVDASGKVISLGLY